MYIHTYDTYMYESGSIQTERERERESCKFIIKARQRNIMFMEEGNTLKIRPRINGLSSGLRSQVSGLFSLCIKH